MTAHTEEEARKLWCPMARMPWVGRPSSDDDLQPVAAVNMEIDGSGPDECKCCASECAMWRWIRLPAEIVGDSARGYCGLAGSPDR